MKKTYSILSVVVVVLSLIIAINAIFSSSMVTVGESSPDTAEISRINPNFSEENLLANEIVLTTDAPTEPTEKKTEKKEKATEKTTKSTTAKPTETTKSAETTANTTTSVEKQERFYATAIPVETPASLSQL